MKKWILGLLGLLMFLPIVAFSAPMTVEGKIAKVVADEREIYVISDADGKKYEYYFNDKTSLTKQGKPVEFSVLAKGQKVRVVAEKTGKRLDPQQVEIIE